MEGGDLACSGGLSVCEVSRRAPSIRSVLREYLVAVDPKHVPLRLQRSASIETFRFHINRLFNAIFLQSMAGDRKTPCSSKSLTV